MTDIFFIAGSTVLIFMTLVFFIAQLKKDNSIVDIAWGGGFIAVTAALSIVYGLIDLIDYIILFSVVLWGVRLSLHIYLRGRGKGEDFRYAEFRKGWGNHPVINAFLKVFLFQGIIMLVISYPILLSFESINSMTILNYLGLFVFLFGFIFESVADLQLSNFKKKLENKGEIIRTGLWKYTRHPNYFGEALVWWGIFFISFGSYLWPTAVISPLLINIFLVKFSGIPMLEKKYEGRKEWEEYKNSTPAFIPWIGKKGY